jgi:hypothetical protein
MNNRGGVNRNGSTMRKEKPNSSSKGISLRISFKNWMAILQRNKLRKIFALLFFDFTVKNNSPSISEVENMNM